MEFSSPMFFALLILGVVHGGLATYRLEPLSAVYIPYMYSNGQGIYDIDAAAVEQSAYDKDAKILYAAGDIYVHILDLADPTKPTIIDRYSLNNRANDIEMCGDYVAYVTEGATSQDNGYLVVREKYNRLFGWREINTIRVGSKPDMLKFSHDCSFIITANEGEAAESPDGSSFVNPEGSVSIVRNFNKFVPFVTTIDFTSFNPYASYYETLGVRAPYKGQLSGDIYNTFSQNMEPEYIAISEDDKRAYVCLQENNAIAVLDIGMMTIDDILPLGRKDWSNLDLDASDKDDDIARKSYDIFSLYQPDAIKMYTYNGEDYLITANEGDKFEYTLGSDGWDEVKRGEDLHDDGDLSDNISSSLDDDMNDDNKLGRLQFSKYDGLDSDGDVLEPHFFGARGVSIFKPGSETMELVWDSGDEVERVIAEYYPEIFNGDTKPDDKENESPRDLKDNVLITWDPNVKALRSAPSTVRTLPSLASTGRPSSLCTVSSQVLTALLSASSPSSVEAEPAIPSRNFLMSVIWVIWILRILNSYRLPTRPQANPLLLVTSTVSGTVSVYQIVNN